MCFAWVDHFGEEGRSSNEDEIELDAVGISSHTNSSSPKSNQYRMYAVSAGFSFFCRALKRRRVELPTVVFLQ